MRRYSSSMINDGDEIGREPTGSPNNTVAMGNDQGDHGLNSHSTHHTRVHRRSTLPPSIVGPGGTAHHLGDEGKAATMTAEEVMTMMMIMGSSDGALMAPGVAGDPSPHLAAASDTPIGTVAVSSPLVRSSAGPAYYSALPPPFNLDDRILSDSAMSDTGDELSRHGDPQMHFAPSISTDGHLSRSLSMSTSHHPTRGTPSSTFDPALTPMWQPKSGDDASLVGQN